MGEQACLDALVAKTITSLEDDGVTKVGERCLKGQGELTSLFLSRCESLDSQALMDCSKLEIIDILGGGSIVDNALNNCKSLAHLLIRSTAKKTILQTASAISGTAISKKRGAVYVDESMLSSYKADSTWNGFIITTLDKYPMSDFSTIGDSWSEIIAKAEAGTAAESYSLGDTKMIDLGSYGKIYMKIVGFGVDQLASDSSQYAGITFIAQELLVQKRRMNPSSVTSQQGYGAYGGWEYSEMRSYLANDIMALLPSALSSGIKAVKKYSDTINVGESAVTHDQVTEDRLWIPNVREMFYNSTINEQTGATYSAFATNNSRYRSYAGGSNGTYWLRTAMNGSSFRTVQNGSTGSATASSELGVLLGFCV